MSMEKVENFCEKLRTGLFLPEVAVYSGVLALVVAGIILAIKNTSAFDFGYAIAGGPIGWLTVPALLSTAILCYRRFRLGRKSGARAFTLFWLLCTLMFVFGTGEKMAWGQRIYQYESPQFFKEHNSKKLMTIHRLVVGGVDINMIIDTGLGIIVVLYLFVFPTVYRKNKKVKLLADSIGMPLPRKRHSVGYALIYLLILLTASNSRGEVVEFAGSWQFFLIALYPANWEEARSLAGIS